ncbi:MAG: dihydroneopterin aldolase [Cyanobacteriota bacterium]|nr:dihydroneopterin aldolase [Cyanobacteriota bacterium]
MPLDVSIPPQATEGSLALSQDRLIISGLRGYGYTGYDPAEQSLGQWFEVDFELWTDLQPAARSGVLSDTIDYRSTVAGITKLINTSRFELIETLIEEIANLILRETGAIQTKVRLTKCHPPMDGFQGKVILEIIRPKRQSINNLSNGL